MPAMGWCTSCSEDKIAATVINYRTGIIFGAYNLKKVITLDELPVF